MERLCQTPLPTSLYLHRDDSISFNVGHCSACRFSDSIFLNYCIAASTWYLNHCTKIIDGTGE